MNVSTKKKQDKYSSGAKIPLENAAYFKGFDAKSITSPRLVFSLVSLFREPVTNGFWTATGLPGFDAGSLSSLFIYLYKFLVSYEKIKFSVVVAARFLLKLLC